MLFSIFVRAPFSVMLEIIILTALWRHDPQRVNQWDFSALPPPCCSEEQNKRGEEVQQISATFSNCYSFDKSVTLNWEVSGVSTIQRREFTFIMCYRYIAPGRACGREELERPKWLGKYLTPMDPPPQIPDFLLKKMEVFDYNFKSSQWKVFGL